jgi:cell division protein FtsQ
VKAQGTPAVTQDLQADENTAPLVDVVAAAPQFQLDPELVSAILSLNTVAPQGTQLLFNAEHGMGWNDKQYGWKVYFGAETHDIDQKLVVYQALAARLKEKGIRPSLVSVEYLHAPYYRLEK